MPVVVRPASAEGRAAVLRALGTDTYGVRLWDRTGFQVECGPARLFLAWSEEFARRGAAGLSRRPMLVGLVAQRAPADASFSVRLVVLAAPAGDGRFHAAVYRGDGRQTLYGSGAVEGDGAGFELRSVKGRGNVATLLRGRVQREAVVFTEARSADRAAERGVPRPVSPR